MPVSFPRRFAAVIFDLDGTLVHSAPDIAAALNAILREEGLAPFAIPETFRFIGAGAERLIADAFAARGVILDDTARAGLTTRYLAAYARRGSPDTTLYPGAREALSTLAALPVALGICTNKAEVLTRGVLAQFELSDQFEAVIGSDSGFGRKPAPEPYREACRRLGVNAADTLMVGDTGTDVRTARAVGAAAAVVRHGYSQVPVESLGADILLDSVGAAAGLVTPP